MRHFAYRPDTKISHIIILFSIYLVGEYCLYNLIGSCISEYPALFTSKQNKMTSSFVSVTEEELFLKNEVPVIEKASKFGKKVFKDLHVLHFLAINAVRMYSKCFVYKR